MFDHRGRATLQVQDEFRSAGNGALAELMEEGNSA
jgi:hypothetical protein